MKLSCLMLLVGCAANTSPTLANEPSTPASPPPVASAPRPICQTPSSGPEAYAIVEAQVGGKFKILWQCQTPRATLMFVRGPFDGARDTVDALFHVEGGRAIKIADLPQLADLEMYVERDRPCARVVVDDRTQVYGLGCPNG
jgi:hypothetical protein